MPLSVIQLVPALEGGGVERGVIEVSQALCERGHRSIVVSSGGRMVRELEAHGAEHRSMPIHRKSPMTLRCVRPLRRLMREIGADVLHARSRVPAWVGYLAWRKMATSDRPVFLTTVHGLNSVNRYSKIMTAGEHVEVVSQTVRDYVLKHYPDTDAEKLFLNYRGVDPEQFTFGYRPDEQWQAAFQREFPQLNHRFVVTLAGRLTRLKGHHDLLQAIAKLKFAGVAAHGLIVGGEDPRRRAYAEELRASVAEHGLQNDVTFTGHRSDIREILAMSDAVVSLSRKPESFGRSVLEAVRLGRPVVGYDHGGVGEVLAQVYPEGLTPLGDIDALAKRLADVAAGEASAPKPTDHFLLADMLDRTLDLYRAAASQRSGT